MATLAEKQEFWDECAQHDWFYDYSDDQRVWDRGRAAEAKLQVKVNRDPEFGIIFKAFQAHIFSGSSFGTAKQPKPERPTDSLRPEWVL